MIRRLILISAVVPVVWARPAAAADRPPLPGHRDAATPIEGTICQRVQARTFPSVFQAWNSADNLPGEPKHQTVARHDLIWHGPRFFGLEWYRRYRGLADGFTSTSIQQALAFRRMLLKLNPNLILIAEIRYRDADRQYLPEAHAWWLRDEQGNFMECYRSKTAADWRRIEETLAWAEENLRAPRVNCLETWYHRSRDDLHLMRATTTLALTHSDGYCLFSDPNPLPSGDHRHNWYAFWDKSLGRPAGKCLQQADGTVTRDFDNGRVVYNPMGNGPVQISLPRPHRSLASGKTARQHQLDCPDGDILLELE